MHYFGYVALAIWHGNIFVSSLFLGQINVTYFNMSPISESLGYSSNFCLSKIWNSLNHISLRCFYEIVIFYKVPAVGSPQVDLLCVADCSLKGKAGKQLETVLELIFVPWLVLPTSIVPVLLSDCYWQGGWPPMESNDLGRRPSLLAGTQPQIRGSRFI